MEIKRGYIKWRDSDGKLHKKPYVGQEELDLSEVEENDEGETE